MAPHLESSPLASWNNPYGCLDPHDRKESPKLASHAGLAVHHVLKMFTSTGFPTIKQLRLKLKLKLQYPIQHRTPSTINRGYRGYWHLINNHGLDENRRKEVVPWNHTIGNVTSATSSSSHTIGFPTSATMSSIHTIGSASTVESPGQTIGNFTSTTSSLSHTIGCPTTATLSSSHTIGSPSTVEASSHIIRFATSATDVSDPIVSVFVNS
ncbi:hypothetical protein MMC08_000359 [Hypocenomyce scalaris]|nr:hypothetical protein [Hypocenomyce scalaris]